MKNFILICKALKIIGLFENRFILNRLKLKIIINKYKLKNAN